MTMILRPFVLAILMLLAACGNKGALYLPQQTAGNPGQDSNRAQQK